MKKIIALVLFTFLFANNVLAKNTVDAVTQVVDTVLTNDVNYTKINKELADTEEALRSGRVNFNEMSKYIKSLTALQEQVSDAKKQTDKELSFVQKRIEALGEEPKDGTKELEVISNKRQEFNSEASVLKGKIAEADVALAKVDELETLILNTRNRELLENLLDKQEPLVYPHNMLTSTAKFVEFFFDIVKSPIDWYSDLKKHEKDEVKANIIPVILTILFSLWIGVFLRVFIKRKFGYRKDIENPRYSTKVSAAIFVAIAYGVIPAAIIGAFLLWIKTTPIMTLGFFGLLINLGLYYLLTIFLTRAIARVIFTPYNEKWRLINVSTEKAKKITSALYFTIIMICVSSFMEHIAREGNYSLELIYYLRAISSAVKAFCIVLVTKRFLMEEKPVSDSADSVLDDENENDIEEYGGEVSIQFKITFSISIFATGVFAASLLGYPTLSAFIFNHFIATILIVGGLIIIRRAIAEAFHRLLLLSFWTKTLKLGRRQLNKIDFWFGMLINPLFILFAIFVLLSMWGVSTDLLWQSLKKLFMGFSVGGVEISIFAILTGIVVFFISLTIVKALRRRLLTNVLDKTEMEEGIKHSLASGFGFFGVIISAVIAIMVMGGNLSNLALIAGALSFGIGLGLQNIVNNCVSGIILLFERPIKVGDWVNVAGQEGIVKQIGIRSTEIETWTKASIIIPNATILSSNLLNMTHKDRFGRVDVKVGVGYDSNIGDVKEILLDIAATNKRVLKKPEPIVTFADFADSTLSFELKCYTSDIMNKATIASEIRTEIYERFNMANIDISLPQRVIQWYTPDHRRPTEDDKAKILKENDAAKKTKKKEDKSQSK